MNCLLGGKENEKTIIPIPHGHITIEVENVSSNYLFFIRNFWNGISRQIRLKFGNCHLGKLLNTERIDGEKENRPGLNPNWLESMDVFQCYTTSNGRFAITCNFKDKNGEARSIKMNRHSRETLHRNFLDTIEHLL